MKLIAIAYRTPDLLILDMIMTHGIDGLETYKRIHQLKPNQKAVIVSGFSETERVKELEEDKGFLLNQIQEKDRVITKLMPRALQGF